MERYEREYVRRLDGDIQVRLDLYTVGCSKNSTPTGSRLLLQLRKRLLKSNHLRRGMSLW